MNAVVDIILIVGVLAGALVGLMRGFVRTVSKPVKLVFALWIAFSLCSVVATKWIEPRIYDSVTSQFSAFLYSHCGDLSSENVAEQLPTVLKVAAALFQVDLGAIDGEDMVAAVVSALSAPFAHFVACILSFLLLYIVDRLLLSLILRLLDAIVSATPLSPFNRILGFLFGAALSFLTVWALTGIFTYVLNIPAVAETAWASAYTGGPVYRFFRSINPIALLLSF